MPTAVAGGRGAWESEDEARACRARRGLAAGVVDHPMDALRGGIRWRSGRQPKEEMSEKMTGGGSVERSFKNKGTTKIQSPSSSANPVGAKIRWRRRSWSRGSRGRRRNLQRKSKPEVGVLRQDPPTLKSVLYLNKNGVLE